MKKLKTLYRKYKAAAISILAVAAYLLLKNIFWPMQKNITVLIQQQHDKIINLNTQQNTSNEKQFVFDKLNFREDDELIHENTGYLGFKNNFFMQLSTKINVFKQANYLFRVSSDDGFRLKIDNSIVCEHIEGRMFSTTECPCQLRPGEHVLELYYYQGPAKMGLKLTYQADGSDEYMVGQNSALMTFHLNDKPFHLIHKTPVEEFKKLFEQANSGDSHAQFILADKYLYANGVNQNNKKAFKWFKKAAVNGETDAQFYLGRMYHLGVGTHQNIEKALSWLTLSANNFNSDAQYYMGKLYYNGNAVVQDYAKAFFWIKKSAAGRDEDNQHPFFVSIVSGNADAQLLLGKMYAAGLGVEKNEELKKKWFLLAAKQGDPEAQANLAKYPKN